MADKNKNDTDKVLVRYYELTKGIIDQEKLYDEELIILSRPNGEIFKFYSN